MSDNAESVSEIRRQRCENCRWWDGGAGEWETPGDTAACRRHPPERERAELMLLDSQPLYNGKRDSLSVVCEVGDKVVCDVARSYRAEHRHPWTGADDWCGEWAARTGDDWEPDTRQRTEPDGGSAAQQHVESTVLACFGIGAPLGPQGWTDGTAAREAARRLWTLTVQPLGDLIAEELSRVLERPVRLEYGRPSGMADLAARARAVAALAKSGISTDDAMLLTGWSDA